MRIGLIIGCARSGTSILGELIAAHEDVKYIFEAHEIWELGGQGRDESHRMTEEHATPKVVKKIRKWFEKQDDGRMIIEKCPRNALRVPYLRKIFPEAKIIHIIRDGRDVTCSLKPGMGGAEWRHLRPENWRELYPLPWYERCARAWKEIIDVTENDLAGTDFLRVIYEELVSEPRRVAKDILEYLNLPPSASVDEFCSRIQDETESSYLPQSNTVRWNTNDHERRIGRWQENLLPEEQRIVQDILADTLQRFGYPLQPLTGAAR